MIAPPNQIGRYEIIREIARSMDVVYEGWDPVAQTRVAVKQLNVAASSSVKEAQVRQGRFEREAQVAASLAHPNVVKILDFGQEGGCPFLVMELVEAPTLGQLLDQRGLLHPDQVGAIAEQLLATVKYAHDKGVIHRDIKPQNLFALPDGSIKLTDFGIASVLSESTFAATGDLLGTLYYMSPEQANGSRVDAKADLWAIGIVLFQSLTGTRPFEGASMVETIQRIISAQVNWPPTVDSKWRPILEKALAKDPAMRFQNAGEMLLAVQRLNMLHPGNKQTASAPTAPISPLLTRPRPTQPVLSPRGNVRREYGILGVLFGILGFFFLAILWPTTQRPAVNRPPKNRVPTYEGKGQEDSSRLSARTAPTNGVAGLTDRGQLRGKNIGESPPSPPLAQKAVTRTSKVVSSETSPVNSMPRTKISESASAIVAGDALSELKSRPVADEGKPKNDGKVSHEHDLPRPPKVGQSKESDSIGQT